MRILVLGANGMLGNAVFRYFRKTRHEIYGTIRNQSAEKHFSAGDLLYLRFADTDDVFNTIYDLKPDVVINAIGIIKQKPEAEDFVTSISINSLFPHKLASMGVVEGFRVIHISSDCVFDGNQGNYTELMRSNALDLYGKSKHLGELTTYRNSVTLRTSIIGHELETSNSLLEWFLKQEKTTDGYVNAIWSGVTATELSRIISDYVLPNKDLFGLYHVAGYPLSKYELLKLIAETYDKNIEIVPKNVVYCDRSLNCTKFSNATGYQPTPWRTQLMEMRNGRKKHQVP